MRAHPELAVLALDLPDSDGEPMENERERFQILLLLDALNQHWKGRQDFYTGGNMFLYYSAQQAHQIIDEIAEPARPRRALRGPDVFIVLHVDGSFRRQKWVVWEEGGRVPDVIFEVPLAVDSQHGSDHQEDAVRADVQTRLSTTGTTPSSPVYSQGWRLDLEAGYQPMTPDARGWLWSPALQLWIGRWEGTYKRDQATWLRFCPTTAGQLLLTADELAEAAAQRADTAEQRAEAAAQRADTATAEVARLRAELARLAWREPLRLGVASVLSGALRAGL